MYRVTLEQSLDLEKLEENILSILGEPEKVRACYSTQGSHHLQSFTDYNLYQNNKGSRDPERVIFQYNHRKFDWQGDETTISVETSLEESIEIARGNY